MNLADKQARVALQQAENKIATERLAQSFAAVLASQDGQILIEHLWKRFDVEGRIFIAQEGGAVCPIRAAIRDGERAAIAYIFNLAKKSNPTLPHPCQTPQKPQTTSAQKTTSSSKVKK